MYSAQEQHTLEHCPLRQQQASVASCYLKYKKRNKDEQSIVAFCSAEMIQLLGYDPTLKQINEIWELLFHDETTPYSFVQTFIPNDITSIKQKKLKRKTLCVCIHEQDNTILCADITDNTKRHHLKQNTSSTVSRNKSNKHTMIITRLTQYGTIDAIFHLDDSSESITPRMETGQPIMKYIHSDDLQRFCAGLSQATKHHRASSSLAHASSTVMITFSVRLLLLSPTTQSPLADDEFIDSFSDTACLKTELTVMTIENGKMLCFMQPLHLVNSSSSTNRLGAASTTTESVSRTYSCTESNSNSSISSCISSNYYHHHHNPYHLEDKGEYSSNEYHYYYFPHNRLLLDTISHMQCKFWYALEHGMLALARHLASLLIHMLWTLIDYGYDAVLILELPIFWKKQSRYQTSETILPEQSSAAVSKTDSHRQITKLPLVMPPGVEALCHGVGWLLKKSPARTKTWVDSTLGQTAEWLSVRSGYDLKSYYQQHIQ